MIMKHTHAKTITLCIAAGGPQVVVIPLSSSTNEFSSATLTCTATSFTQATLSWYSLINGQMSPITASSSVNIQQSTNNDQIISILTLVSASRPDTGQYICNVTSLQANSTAVATLTVYCKPVYAHCSSLSFSLPQLLPLSISSSRTK